METNYLKFASAFAFRKPSADADADAAVAPRDDDVPIIFTAPTFLSTALSKASSDPRTGSRLEVKDDALDHPLPIDFAVKDLILGRLRPRRLVAVALAGPSSRACRPLDQTDKTRLPEDHRLVRCSPSLPLPLSFSFLRPRRSKG